MGEIYKKSPILFCQFIFFSYLCIVKQITIEIMKKVLWLIVCLMTMVLSVNAQNGWEKTTFDGDELLGTETYVATSFEVNGVGMVVYYSNDNSIKLVTDKGIFDYKDDKVTVTIGYYNENGDLVKKRCESFYIGKSSSSCQYIYELSKLTARKLEFDASFKKKKIKELYLKMAEECRIDKGKEFVDYITTQKGFVRFVAEKYGTNTKFDIKVPCINN